MEIKVEYPPNIELIKKHFPLKPGVVFTYGASIYNPDNGFIDEALFYHEMTHSLQQGKNPEAWWLRYLAEPDFRFVQELEAYQNQYQRFCQLEKDRNKQARFLSRIAWDLSSPLYGKICSLSEARQAIKDNVKFKLNRGNTPV
jgi:hypothetical protein